MKVRLAVGKTFNIGNYESLRIDVALEDDCTQETYEEKCKEVYDKVIDYFNSVYKELKND